MAAGSRQQLRASDRPPLPMIRARGHGHSIRRPRDFVFAPESAQGSGKDFPSRQR
jgi:hypothetical protein